jgi:dimethylhistidine N-methyltransferase
LSVPPQDRWIWLERSGVALDAPASRADEGEGEALQLDEALHGDPLPCLTPPHNPPPRDEPDDANTFRENAFRENAFRENAFRENAFRENALREAVLHGLQQHPKRISPVWFYDERGSCLFDEICDLPEYYVTRTELSIMREHLPGVAALVGPHACVIEPGSGTSLKTRLLLDALDRPDAYIPVDVAQQHLDAAAAQLRSEYPGLLVHPICADFTAPFTIPELGCSNRVVYFPGSTIGNFDRHEAIALLRQLREATRARAMLIGVDLVKDPHVLVPAYDDAEGVTAEFNLNALEHLNSSLGTDFDTTEFHHRAVWNAVDSRIEMHLVSQQRQRVSVGDDCVDFARGEALVTEHSHKYTLESFAELARAAGWRVERVWMDPQHWFSIQWLLAEPPPAGGAGTGGVHIRPLRKVS